MEITVLKKLKENEILAIKEKCATTFGGECEADKFCMICAVGDDVKELCQYYDNKDQKMDFGKLIAQKTSKLFR